MDPSAPQTVLKGIAITSSLCGVVASLYGGFKHGTPTKFLLYSAVNSGIVAATFFSIREYVVSPVLVVTHPGRQYQLRRQKLFRSVGDPTESEEPTSLSWGDIRTSRLLDSGISGGLAGSILNALKRGRPGLAPGLATGALMCTLLQWCFNEFNIFRIRSISANSAALSQNTILVDSRHSLHSAMQPPSVGSPAPRSLMEYILSIFGQPVSDEKYLERLKTERDSYLRRIAELEGRKK